MNPPPSYREKREPTQVERFWQKRITDAEKAVADAEKALAKADCPAMQRYAFLELETKKRELQRAYRQR
jgi:hypothetical protein